MLIKIVFCDEISGFPTDEITKIDIFVRNDLMNHINLILHKALIIHNDLIIDRKLKQNNNKAS